MCVLLLGRNPSFVFWGGNPPWVALLRDKPKFGCGLPEMAPGSDDALGRTTRMCQSRKTSKLGGFALGFLLNQGEKGTD